MLIVVSVAANVVFAAATVTVVVRKGGLPYVAYRLGLRPKYIARDEEPEHRHAGLPIDADGVVFIGDSLTSMAPLGDLLAGLHNRGIGGQTVAEIARRVPAVLAAGAPRRVVLLAGTNDLLRGRAPSQVAADYAGLLDEVEKNAPGAPVTVLGVPPVNNSLRGQALDPGPAVAPFNAELRRLVESRGHRWVDLHAALVGPDGLLMPEYTSDGVHLTARGYVRVRDELAAAARH